MTNDQVIRDFVERRSLCDATSKTMHCISGRLYSYNTCIAKFVVDYNYVLLTLRNYSNTTARQKAQLCRMLGSTGQCVVFTGDEIL